MNPTILITGANGFTGFHACKHFKKAGYHVVGLTRGSTSIDSSIPFRTCNLTDRQQVTNVIESIKPDLILHLAGKNSVQDSWLDPIGAVEANVLSTMYIVEAVRQAAVPSKVLVVGSALQFNLEDIASVEHPYSLSKSIQVLIAQAWEKFFELEILIAKPSNLIGPGYSNGVCSVLAKQVTIMEKNQADPIIKVNNLLAKRDFLDVRDAVFAYEKILEHGKAGEVFDVVSGSPRSLMEITDLLKKLSKVKVSVQSVKDKEEEMEEKKPLELLRLGWRQEIPLEESIKDILQFHRENLL